MARTVRKVSMYTLMALLLAVIVVMVVLSIVAYDRATSANAQTRVLYNLETRVRSRGAQVSLFLQKQLGALESAARTFDADGEELPARLNTAQETLGFAWLCYVDEDGLGVRDDGAAVTLADFPGAAAALEGETLFCDGESDGAPCVLLATGAGDGGALVGCLDVEALGVELVSNGSVCLLDAQGSVVAAAPDSFLEALMGEDLFAALDMSKSAREEMLQSEGGGRLVYTSRGTMMTAWVTLSVGDGWRIVSLAPRDEAMGQFSFMNDAALVLAVRLGACALALVALVIWVAWAGNRRLRAEKLRLEWSEERYRILAEGNNEVFWEYDVLNDRLRLGENFQRVFGREGSRTISEFLAIAHPEEREQLQRIFGVLKAA